MQRFIHGGGGYSGHQAWTRAVTIGATTRASEALPTLICIQYSNLLRDSGNIFSVRFTHY